MLTTQYSAMFFILKPLIEVFLVVYKEKTLLG